RSTASPTCCIAAARSTPASTSAAGPERSGRYELGDGGTGRRHRAQARLHLRRHRLTDQQRVGLEGEEGVGGNVSAATDRWPSPCTLVSTMRRFATLAVITLVVLAGLVASG